MVLGILGDILDGLIAGKLTGVSGGFLGILGDILDGPTTGKLIGASGGILGILGDILDVPTVGKSIGEPGGTLGAGKLIGICLIIMLNLWWNKLQKVCIHVYNTCHILSEFRF